MTTDPKIVSEIRKLREKYPRLGEGEYIMIPILDGPKTKPEKLKETGLNTLLNLMPLVAWKWTRF